MSANIMTVTSAKGGRVTSAGVTLPQQVLEVEDVAPLAGDGHALAVHGAALPVERESLLGRPEKIRRSMLKVLFTLW